MKFYFLLLAFFLSSISVIPQSLADTHFTDSVLLTSSVMEPSKTPIAKDMNAEILADDWKKQYKKGLKRSSILEIKNKRLDFPQDIALSLSCINLTAPSEFQSMGLTPKKAYKKWMQTCDFTSASMRVTRQQAIEKQKYYESQHLSHSDIYISESLKNTILNPAYWDADTKTILGNQHGITHLLSNQQDEVFKTLGVKELIGIGITRYTGSDESRIKNFTNAVSKFNGKLIHPGESLSALKILTPFTTENGYTTGKVILEGELQDEIGGGVCQTVTTLFRAWSNAGLEITKTQPHSKVVEYYGGIGLDATMYEGEAYASSVDLLLKNDSNTSVFIQSFKTNGYLIILLYGTKDRSVILKRTGFEETTSFTKATWKKTIKSFITGETNEKTFLQKQRKDSD